MKFTGLVFVIIGLTLQQGVAKPLEDDQTSDHKGVKANENGTPAGEKGFHDVTSVQPSAGHKERGPANRDNFPPDALVLVEDDSPVIGNKRFRQNPIAPKIKEVPERLTTLEVDGNPVILEVDEQSALLEVDEKPVILEVDEQPALLGVGEIPALFEVDENPVILEVDEEPALLGLSENPALFEVDKNPVILEVDEQPALLEVEENLVIPEVDEKSTLLEVDEITVIRELDKEPTLPLGVDEVPVILKIDEESTLLAVGENPALLEENEEPIVLEVDPVETQFYLLPSGVNKKGNHKNESGHKTVAENFSQDKHNKTQTTSIDSEVSKHDLKTQTNSFKIREYEIVTESTDTSSTIPQNRSEEENTTYSKEV